MDGLGAELTTAGISGSSANAAKAASANAGSTLLTAGAGLKPAFGSVFCDSPYIALNSAVFVSDWISAADFTSAPSASPAICAAFANAGNLTLLEIS